jgi:glycosyltransferase involved in cell wall biosynthesis
VAGDAACYAELNADSYAAAMKRLYADLEYRAVLIELGRKRCDLFSWDRTADLTLRVYNSILKH